MLERSGGRANLTAICVCAIVMVRTNGSKDGRG